MIRHDGIQKSQISGRRTPQKKKKKKQASAAVLLAKYTLGFERRWIYSACQRYGVNVLNLGFAGRWGEGACLRWLFSDTTTLPG